MIIWNRNVPNTLVEICVMSKQLHLRSRRSHFTCKVGFLNISSWNLLSFVQQMKVLPMHHKSVTHTTSTTPNYCYSTPRSNFLLSLPVFWMWPIRLYQYYTFKHIVLEEWDIHLSLIRYGSAINGSTVYFSPIQQQLKRYFLINWMIL